MCMPLALLEHTTSMTYSEVTSSPLRDFRIQMHLIETIFPAKRPKQKYQRKLAQQMQKQAKANAKRKSIAVEIKKMPNQNIEEPEFQMVAK